MTDTTALNQFLAGVEKRAFAMAMFKVKDTEEAMDIVQDTMMMLVKKYATKPQEQWPPLFYRILQNRINDTYRKHSMRARFFSIFTHDHDEDRDADPIQNAPASYSAEPDFQVGMQGATAALKQALELLSPRQHQAFLLRAWEGLSVAATARAMQCSQGSVKTHYFRAIQSLREELKDDWI
ncbi:MAG: RNA polymerase sigma factor [Pseudomonadales bacterium]|nr:RNA polymerase sigma factor [Pseudomonadales bacterium]